MDRWWLDDLRWSHSYIGRLAGSSDRAMRLSSSSRTAWVPSHSGHNVPRQTKAEAAGPLEALVWNSLDVTGHSKSPGQPQFQGPGDRLHLLMRGAEKYWGHFLQCVLLLLYLNAFYPTAENDTAAEASCTLPAIYWPLLKREQYFGKAPIKTTKR